MTMMRDLIIPINLATDIAQLEEVEVEAAKVAAVVMIVQKAEIKNTNGVTRVRDIIERVLTGRVLEEIMMIHLVLAVAPHLIDTLIGRKNKRRK